MKTLENHLAFNAAYREQWRIYLGGLDEAARNTRLERLVAGLDSESRELCNRHLSLAPYLFPHPLLEQVYVPDSARRAFLPDKTLGALERAGLLDGRQERLDRLQMELDLPEDPLPELLLHSGLGYLPKIARSLIRGRPVIDGGAFVGDTARLFQALYAPSRVIAVEPQPENYARLERAIAGWGQGDIIFPVSRALSERPGPVDIWGEGVGASMIRKAPNGSGEPAVQGAEATTIDALAAEFELQDTGLIKLDIEGYELSAIRGGLETIRRDRPLLLVSIYHTAEDFFEIKPLLEELELGYEFLVRKLTDDLIKELVLIGIPAERAG